MLSNIYKYRPVHSKKNPIASIVLTLKMGQYLMKLLGKLGGLLFGTWCMYGSGPPFPGSAIPRVRHSRGPPCSPLIPFKIVSFRA